MLRRTILPVLAATAWIGFSEFARNQFLLKPYWIAHYQKLGLVFPDKPVNAAVWGVWSLLFALAVYAISRKFTLLETTLLSWYLGFMVMWVVIGNLGILPFGILKFGIPLSLLEAFLAAYIVKRAA
jgi:hypothetical protein